MDWHDFYEVKFSSRRYFSELLYRIVDIRALVNFKSILGVGSGRAFTENLFSKDKYVVASDRNVSLVHAAKNHVRKVDFVACDGFSLPFTNCSFECVYSQGLLEHFEVSKAKDLLQEMGRVGENVVFSVPLEGYDAPLLDVEYRREREEWQKIISDVFDFTDFQMYFYKREAVLIGSHQPLGLMKRFALVEAVKRVLFSSKPT